MKAKISISVLLFLALVGSLAMPLQTARAAAITVCASGCDYTTIQAAITAAAPGATINVGAGTYAGNITVNKSVTILGDAGDSSPGPGPSAPIIDGGSLPGDAFLIANGISNVTIQGFEIRNFTSNDTGIGNGISAWVGSTSNITIQDNYFHNLGWNGVLVGNDGAIGDHTNWTIKGNILEKFAAYGFELTNASNSSIEDNVIHSDAVFDPATCIMVDARRNEAGITIKNNQIDGPMVSGFAAVFVFADSFETPNANLNNVLIDGNTIATTGTAKHIWVYNYAGTGTVTGVHVHTNSLSTLSTNTPALVDATNNWWGADSGPGVGAVVGNVSISPWCVNEACSGNPPPLPSNFYGGIHIYDNPPSAGGTVDAYVPGVSGIAASATITSQSGVLSYQIDVPGDVVGTSAKEGGMEGDTITFQIGSRVVATYHWHSGTNVRLDIHPPQAVPGAAKYGLAGTAISFSGSANDWGGSVGSTYEWSWDDGTLNTIAQNPTHSWATPGTYTVGLKVTDSQNGVGTGTATVNIATITLGSLSQSYNRTPRSATATTNPPGLTVDFAYYSVYPGTPLSGAPTNAGSYAVVASIAGYTGTANDTLIIGLAGLAITADDQTKVYGTTFTFAGTEFTPVGLFSGDSVTSVALYSAGAVAGATVAGSTYPITPSTAVGSGLTNYTIEYNDGAMTVTPASASITLSNLTPVGDGNPKVPTVVTVPPGLSYSLAYYSTYPGTPLPSAPSAPGSYTVVATITDPNYTGSTTDTMVILGTHPLALVAGWNLVSFNLHPADTTPASVLSDIAGKYDLVYGWDGSGGHPTSGHWMKYAPGVGFGDTLLTLDETMGFWIHMTVADTLHLVGSLPTTTNISLATAAYNWNLVGYPASVARDLPFALSDHGVGTDFSLVYAYHANETANPWKLFDIEVYQTFPWVNDLTAMSSGWGYWIQVSAANTWSVDYLAP